MTSLCPPLVPWLLPLAAAAAASSSFSSSSLSSRASWSAPNRVAWRQPTVAYPGTEQIVNSLHLTSSKILARNRLTENHLGQYEQNEQRPPPLLG